MIARHGSPVVVIGPARSGTTYVATMLALSPSTTLAMEPHMLWRAGNFSVLHDELPLPDLASRSYVRRRLYRFARGKTLIEKSPPNSLRPNLVHAMVPSARVVYVQRSPVDLLRSNIQRTTAGQALVARTIAKKYLLPGVPSRTADEHLDAVGTIPLTEQLRLRDIPASIRLVSTYAMLRRRGLLPFGPRIPGFYNILRGSGITTYHVEVLKRTIGHLQHFKKLFGDRLLVVSFEDIRGDADAAMALIDSLGLVLPSARHLQTFVQGGYESASDSAESDIAIPTHTVPTWPAC